MGVPADMPYYPLPYLKQVSRVKHRILRQYLAPWATILGARHQRLGYVDCFAGGGAYHDEKGGLLPGSPLIAIRVASEHARRRPGSSLLLSFVEKDHETAERLRALLSAEQEIAPTVSYQVIEESAQDFAERLCGVARGERRDQAIPTFFFIDPYGHPITVPVMRELLALGRTEILVNLMWFRLSMDLRNPYAQGRIDRLFGHSRWRGEEFMVCRGWRREHGFIDYFIEQVGANHHLRFSVPFSPEDPVSGRERRRKYYLLHFSGHPKAALLMKGIMLNAVDDLEELQFGGHGTVRQLKLAGTGPNPRQLSLDLLQRFGGKRVSFEEVQTQTLDWPYLEKHYRAVLKDLEATGAISIVRVESKQSGLKGRDVVCFPHTRGHLPPEAPVK